MMERGWVDTLVIAVLSVLLVAVLVIGTYATYLGNQMKSKCSEACSPFELLGCQNSKAICATQDPWTANIVDLNDPNHTNKCRGCFE